MNRTIREKADAVATLRFVSVQLMETLARWVPTTSELEFKTLFGRHIWDLAQHADALGHRTAELKAALHYSRAPREAYQTILNNLTALSDSGDRVAAFYDGILPDLASKYRQYVDATDALLDEPTVRIVERILSDFSRMQDEARSTREERSDVQPTQEGNADFAARFSNAPHDFVDYRPAPEQEAVPR